MERNTLGVSAFYSFEHLRYHHYELRYLEPLHLLLVRDPLADLLYYLWLTPWQDTILWHLLTAPADRSVPFGELLPSSRPHLPRRRLHRQVYHLNKQFPPRWRIVCDSGLGYRLRIISPLPHEQEAGTSNAMINKR